MALYSERSRWWIPFAMDVGASEPLDGRILHHDVDGGTLLVNRILDIVPSVPPMKYVGMASSVPNWPTAVPFGKPVQASYGIVDGQCWTVYITSRKW